MYKNIGQIISDIQIDQKKSKKNRTIDRTLKYIGQKIGQKKSEKKSGIQIERTKNWTKNIGRKNLTFK